jgi:hypothetical protein
METKYEKKVNTGSIFRNDYKKQDSHPDFKGEINVHGELMDIALWENKTKKGSVWFGVRVSEKREDQRPAAKPDISDSDVPF